MAPQQITPARPQLLLLITENTWDMSLMVEKLFMTLQEQEEINQSEELTLILGNHGLVITLLEND